MSYTAGPITHIVQTLRTANELLTQMDETIHTYGSVSLADLHDLLNIHSDFRDNRYGWRDIYGAKVEQTNTGHYRVTLPRPVELDRDQSSSKFVSYTKSERGTLRYSKTDMTTLIDTAEELTKILDGLQKKIKKYKKVSVAEFYNLIGRSSSLADVKYGWADLSSNIKINLLDSGEYLLGLPLPIQLFEEEHPSRQIKDVPFDKDRIQIYADTKDELHGILSSLEEIVTQYQAVSIEDLHELLGEDSLYSDQHRGWTNLDKAFIDESDEGYILTLPKADQLYQQISMSEMLKENPELARFKQEDKIEKNPKYRLCGMIMRDIIEKLAAEERGDNEDNQDQTHWSSLWTAYQASLSSVVNLRKSFLEEGDN